MNLGRIKECYHHHRAQVIGDGKRDQNRHQPGRRPLAEQNQHRDSKGNVGGHRNTPTMHSRPAPIDRAIHQRRGNHPPEGSDNRQCGLTGRRQLTDHYLVFNFQADQEEK